MRRSKGAEERKYRSAPGCKPGEVPVFHFGFEGLQDIDSGLQTCFAEVFSDAGLDAVEFCGGRVVSAVVFPVVGILQQPVPVICKDDVFVVFLPALLACAFVFMFALDASAGDLSIAKARIGINSGGAIQAAFFFGFMAAGYQRQDDCRNTVVRRQGRDQCNAQIKAGDLHRPWTRGLSAAPLPTIYGYPPQNAPKRP